MHNPVLLVFVKLLITGTSNVDDNVIKQFEYGTLGDGYGMGVMVPAACLVIFLAWLFSFILTYNSCTSNFLYSTCL